MSDELKDTPCPESYTLGRMDHIIEHGCDPWRLLEVLVDYYEDMMRRQPEVGYWKQRRDVMAATRQVWVEGHKKWRVK